MKVNTWIPATLIVVMLVTITCAFGQTKIPARALGAGSGSPSSSTIYRGDSGIGAWAGLSSPLEWSGDNLAIALGTSSAPGILQVDGTSITVLAGVISAAGGSGTVTSVGLSLPSIFSVSGSPVTSYGTLTGSLATEMAHYVWAGPTSGSAASPGFRALVLGDIPSLSSLYDASGAAATAQSNAEAASLPVGTSISTTAPITGGGSLSSGLTIAETQAATSTSGYLSSTDWNTFNNKGTGNGTVTSFSTGNLSPLFNASVATATTTPALSFSLSNAAASSWYGNSGGSTGPPAFNTSALPIGLIPSLSSLYLTGTTGDVTTTGEGVASASVTRVQGQTVSSTSATNDQLWRYNAADSQFEPSECAIIQSSLAVSVTNVSSLSGTITIDGISLVAGNRVLLTGQSTGSQNGLWTVQTSTWTRPATYASGTSISPSTIVPIAGGTVYHNTMWQLTGTTTSITVDTTSTSWGQIGAGSVTSVAMTMPGAIFNTSVTGSPITTSGTLAPSLLTQIANTVLAGPTTGSAATPTFRALVPADVPTLNQNTTGNAATVTTNANLTGPITSVGNATSIAAQTGTGTTFAMSVSPALTGSSTFTASGTGIVTGTTYGFSSSQTGDLWDYYQYNGSTKSAAVLSPTTNNGAAFTSYSQPLGTSNYIQLYDNQSGSGNLVSVGGNLVLQGGGTDSITLGNGSTMGTGGFVITAHNAVNIPLTLKGTSAQSGNLLQTEDSASNNNFIVSNGGGITNDGHITCAALGTPPTPTAVVSGTTGSTNYYFEIVGVSGTGSSLPGGELHVTNGNATLSSTNKITLSWTQMAGAEIYSVYAGTTSGGEALYASGITALSEAVTGNTFSGAIPNPGTGGISAGLAATTVSGSTSGTAIFNEPFQGAGWKQVVIQCSSLLGTASYTYPVAFTYAPTELDSLGLATTISTTACTVTGTTTSKTVVLGGY